ncbi:Hypothetical protein ETEE_3782 [Edwardsiella anguillarum ET080813]|uniref:Uncharacterized protein n=1 Tax=Edwardsiella anguillarum ET080813 TaxID=667120 RepID=A0A076LXP1_9GAMM|nr:Hypothetical protein ETEE_3782 [Edwardsiella anguillarum ET080813]
MSLEKISRVILLIDAQISRSDANAQGGCIDHCATDNAGTVRTFI